MCALPDLTRRPLVAAPHVPTTPSAGGQLLPDWLVVVAMAFGILVPAEFMLPTWPLVLVLVGGSVFARRRELGRLWLPVSLVCFLVWVMLSAIWSVERAATVNMAAQLVLFSLIGLGAAVGRRVGDLLRVAAQASFIVVGVNILSAVVSPGTAIGLHYGDVAMKGVFSNKNALGFQALMAMLALGAHAISQAGRQRTWAVLGFVGATGLLLASTSRTAWVMALAAALIAAALAFVVRFRRPVAVPVVAWAVAAALVGGVVYAYRDSLLLLLGRDPTLTNRTVIWQIVGDAIAQRPVTGYGWGALWQPGMSFSEQLWAKNNEIPFYHAHSGYLDVAIQVGVVGLILVMIFWASVTLRAADALLRRRSVALGWVVLVMAVLFTYNSTEVVGFRGSTWLLVCAFAGVLATARKEHSCISRTLPRS